MDKDYKSVLKRGLEQIRSYKEREKFIKENPIDEKETTKVQVIEELNSHIAFLYSVGLLQSKIIEKTLLGFQDLEERVLALENNNEKDNTIKRESYEAPRVDTREMSNCTKCGYMIRDHNRLGHCPRLEQKLSVLNDYTETQE